MLRVKGQQGSSSCSYLQGDGKSLCTKATQLHGEKVKL